ncbi:hypothetical protein D9M71_813660 [compost metagenome]
MLVEQANGFGALIALVQVEHGRQDLIVVAMKFFEGSVLDLVFIGGDGAAIALHMLLQTRFKGLEVFRLLGAEPRPLFEAKNFLGPQVTVDPGAAHHRTVIQAR